MNRRYKTHNEPFINYAYQRLKRSTEEERSLLTMQERKMFASDKALNIFCKQETKEKIDMILTKIGVEWVQVYGDNPDDICSSVVNCWEQYSWPRKKLDVIRTMVESNIFATGSREHMLSLHMASVNSATKNYSVSQYAQEMVESGKLYNKMKTYAEEMDEAKEAQDEFSRLLVAQMNSFRWVRENLGMTPEELNIMCVLFQNRNITLFYYELLDGIEMAGNYVFIGRFMSSLADKKYVTHDAEDNKPKTFKPKTCFMINSLGIERVVRYHRYIHEITFGRKKKRNNKLY